MQDSAASLLGGLFSESQDSSSLRYGDLKLEVAERSGKAVHSLLADQVFSPAFALAEAIELGVLNCPGGDVLEFGSASGLPSLLLASYVNIPSLFDLVNDAMVHSMPDAPGKVILSDHPAIVGLTGRNAAANSQRLHSVVSCIPHVWGEDPTPLLDPTGGTKYVLVLMSDLLWLKDSAEELVQSLDHVLADGGHAWIGAGDYTPQPVVDRFEHLLGERDIVWSEQRLEPGWRGTTQIEGPLFNDSGTEPSEEEIRQAMAERKSHTRVWIARRKQR